MATPITKVCLFEIWTKRYVLTLLKQIEPINLFSHDMSVKMKSTLFFFDLIFIFRLQNIFSIETMLLVQLLTWFLVLYRPGQPNCTMWKFQDFSATQILREINQLQKLAFWPYEKLWILNFCIFLIISSVKLPKNQKFKAFKIDFT